MAAFQRICVFCGSSSGAQPAFLAAAADFGRLLAAEGVTLVYGGGNVGLMGEVANAALASGGKVIGVMPTFLRDKELAHQGLSELHIVDSMHSRKALMADLADAFVALPGGFGTFDELFEILTWAQLGVHDKPVGVLDVAGFFRPLHAFIESTVAAGFVKPDNARLLQWADSGLQLLAQLRGGAASAAPGVGVRP